MTIERKRVLAVAVASRKIAFVLLIDGRLKDWKHSRAGGMSPTKGRSFLRMAIGHYEPDLVVIEDPNGPTRKYGIALGILYTMAQDLGDCAVPYRLLNRKQSFANKYAEAAALAEQFPEIGPYLPKRPRIWETEPTETIYFEALALAKDAMMA